jgi:hypothetical protein
MEVMLLTLSVLTEATDITVPMLGWRRVELGLLDARSQRVDAMDAVHKDVVASGSLAMGMSQPAPPNADN